MAKVTPAPLDPGALPHFRSTVVYRDTVHGIVVQAWPQDVPATRSARGRQWQTRFGFAGRMASSPHPIDFQTAIEMAKGTEQVPRDILTMAALGRYYEIINPDGTTWGHVEGPVYIPPEPPPMPALPEGYDLRFDATEGVATSGSTVTAWADAAPGGYDLTPPTGKAPTFNPDAGGTGKPGVVFTATQALVASPPATGGPLWRALVITIPSVAGSVVCDGTGSIGRAFFGSPGTGITTLRQSFGSTGATLGTMPQTLAVWLMLWSGATYVTRKNGTTVVESPSWNSIRTGLTLGNSKDLDRPAGLTVHELIDWPRFLSPAEEAQIVDYLTEKWL